MEANATSISTNLNGTEMVESTTNPIVTSSSTIMGDVIARQNSDQTGFEDSTWPGDNCVINYPLWRSGDNCMTKQLTEDILFALSIG